MLYGSHKLMVFTQPEPAKLHALTTQDDFSQVCLNKRGLCVIAFIPPRENDPQYHDSRLEVVQELLKKRGAGTFRFMWVDGEKEEKFKDSFAPAADLPVLIVLSPQKKRYGRFVGAWTLESMDSYLDNILSGRGSTSPLDPLPSLSK